jgi:CBS domain-containing protein
MSDTLKARDVMTSRIATTTEDASLPSVVKTLEAGDFTAALVLDGGGRVVGVVSFTDVLRSGNFVVTTGTDRPSIDDTPVTVKDVMTTPVLTVKEEDDFLDAVRVLVGQRVHRVYVTRDGAAVGAVTTRDVLKIAVERHIETPISEFMSSPAETIDLGDSIDAALTQLQTTNVRGLVVVDGTMPIGVFTQREAIRARGLPAAFRVQAVEQVMSYETICYDESTPLYRAAGAMASMSTRRILATRQRSLAGVLTGYDLARALVTDS